jgi:hypothetical protein
MRNEFPERHLAAAMRMGEQINTLPVAPNSRFFGREDILNEIEGHLQPENTAQFLTSVTP